jgi:hypothetical protein
MIQRSWALALVLAVAAVLVTGAAVAATEPPGPLDGKTFVGETGKKGQGKGDPETFVFAGWKFDPLQCHPYGFAAAPYKATSVGGKVGFEAKTVSAKEGTMHWKGTALGTSIQGTMTWTKKGQAPIEYWFRGRLKS